ncbi:HET-domain-containing protein [Xylaria cf. heliscus]|nr:HET-domain-containing protein [Xylaria cf. heliscus]
MPFCSLCSSLDLGAISRTSVIGLFGLSETKHPDHSLFIYRLWANRHQAENNLTPHYDSLSHLSINAKSCQLCHLIQSSIDAFLKGFESRKKRGYYGRIPDYEIWLVGRHDADGFQILGLEKGRVVHRPSYYLMGGVGFCLDNLENHLRDIIPRRMVPLSPLSPSVLERIKSWITECTEKHEHLLSQESFMPTRLLKIVDFGQQVCLHFPGTEHNKYAVLSHCWGSIAATTLKSSSLHQLKAGIRTEDLPRTFQDAVWLAYQLGIQFLWIDSLCIVQDDPDDWAQESATMHNVYNNSFVTIAASRATESSEGFLGNRIEKSYVPVPFHSERIAGEVLAFSLPLNHVADPERSVWMEHEPLSHRAWAFQERYLSRRTLHFASDQIFFECEKSCAAEDVFQSKRYQSVSKIMSGDHFENMDEESCLREWHRLVEMYSMRKLTVRDDKLPALSGLAACFSRQLSIKSHTADLPSQYLAGLWSNNIIGELYWQCNGKGIPPEKYRAPSWSWASLDGQIDYRGLRQGSELAIVENTHVDLESPSRKFGKVLGGWISMKVIKLRPRADSVIGPGNLEFSEDGVSFRLGCSWDLDSFTTSGRRKSVLSVMKQTELVVILLQWTDYQDQGEDDDRIFGPQCLILKRVDNCSNQFETTAPVFQRIGSGVAMAAPGNRLKLKRLITDKWAMMKQQGNLEDIVIV